MREAQLKKLHIYNSNHLTFWKTQNYKNSKNITGWQRLGAEKEELISRMGFLGHWHYYLVWYVTMNAYHYIFVKTHRINNIESKS